MHRAVLAKRCPWLDGNLTAATKAATCAAALLATTQHPESASGSDDSANALLPVADLDTELHCGLDGDVLDALVHYLYTDR